MSPVRIIATKRRALSAHALVRPAVPIRASHRQRITSLAAAMRVQHPHVRLSTTGYSPANDLKVLFSFHLDPRHGWSPRRRRDFSSSYSIMVLLSMVIFVAAFATGLGNISWQQGELFGLAVRDIGTSVCTAVNWYVLPCRSISLNVQDAHLWVRIRSCNP